MAQADGVVANASGAAVRQDINNQLEAAFTNQSGNTAPATTYPCQFYADIANDLLKIRDKDSGSTYYTLRTLSGGVVGKAGTAAAPGIFFDGSATTGFYKYANDVVGISRAGSAYGVIGRTIESQTNAFVIGNAATRATAKNPSTATDETATGFCVAGPVDSNDGGGQVHIGSSARCLSLNRVNQTGTKSYVDFFYDGSFVSSINSDGSTISYNTGSDYRLKENVIALTDAKDRVNQLNTYRFNFISDSTSQVVDGFLAHEVQTVVPEAITGDKDETFEDGSPKYQLIDQSKIVPLLTAALQEAFAEIAALTARVEALEAG
jgi:hypothetical protein|tara:strand:+ start:548 stop:1510 length:963 start_codon:yes stop_codon:yes gene_type:complete